MRRFSLLAPCITAAAVLGCSTSGLAPSDRASRSVTLSGGGLNTSRLEYFQDVSRQTDHVPAAPAMLWPRLAATYAALAIPVTMVDTAARIVGAVRASLTGRIGKRPLSYAIDCGSTPYGSPRANSYRVSLSVLTQLTPAGSGSNVTSVVTASAQDENASSTAAQCSSTGALERDIAAALAAP